MFGPVTSHPIVSVIDELGSATIAAASCRPVAEGAFTTVRYGNSSSDNALNVPVALELKVKSEKTLSPTRHPPATFVARRSAKDPLAGQAIGAAPAHATAAK